jgi:diacylglycerol kinase (ATP)
MQLIVNPAAGRGTGRHLASAIHRRLADFGVRATLREASNPGHITTLVADALASGERRIVIAGGDGSLNEAVNGYVGRAGADQALGLIPIGTGNDFAKVAGVPRRWRDACDRLVRATPTAFDAGCCNGHWFINGIGAGLDARVAQAASRVRRIRGPLTYAVGLLNVLGDHRRPPHGIVVHDTGTYRGGITLMAIMNGRVLGGLFPIAPDADPTDGRFRLVIGGDLSRRQIVALLPALLRGRHLGRPGVAYVTTRGVRASFDEPVPLHIDGEVLAEPVTEIEASLAPGAVRLLV